MKNGIVWGCLMAGFALITAVLPARGADLYRTNAVGTWADGQWRDAGGSLYSEPVMTDNAIVGATGYPGRISSAVTLASGTAVANNVYLGYYTGAGAFYPVGILTMSDNTTLTISNTLMIGSGSTTPYGTGAVYMAATARIEMGNLDLNASTFTYKGGSLSVTGTVYIGRQYIRFNHGATLIQDGGTQSVGGNVQLSDGSTSSGESFPVLILTNGATLQVGGLVSLGSTTGRGQGVLSMTPNSKLITRDLTFSASYLPAYYIRGDSIVVSNKLLVGTWSAGSVTVLQDGGTLQAGYITLGDGTLVGDSGIYRMSNSATLQLTRRATGATTNYASGGAGVFQRGYWYMGDAVTPGTVTLAGAGSGKHDLIVRSGSTLTNAGAVVGWGSFGMDGRLTMNGFIIADGYGTDRDLTMTNFTIVTNTIENTYTNIGWSTNGWYARNGGRLLLPAQTISSGNSTVNWGEAIADTNIDLVNSARLRFSGVTGGKLAISLLATNRADAYVASGNVIGVWNIDTAPGFDFGSGTATVTFRYDSVLAAQKGLTEENLKLWRKSGTSWQDVSGSVNVATNFKQIVSANTLTSFGLFAVSTDIPKAGPSTGVLMLVR